MPVTSFLSALAANTRKTIGLYVALLRIIVPVAIIAQALVAFGIINALAPALAPLMQLYGLPPELAFAWLTGVIVGLWPAVVIIFTLVPVDALTGAQMTVFASLLLFVHSIPIEQRIMAQAGPRFWPITLLRIAGGLIFAALAHAAFSSTGALSDPIDPTWIPVSYSEGWGDFFGGLLHTLALMFVILLGLSWSMELLRQSGVLERLNGLLAPVFALAGIKTPTVPCSIIGLFLGVTYGGGMIIRETRESNLPPRQVFIACVFMGFAHGIIEDTLVMVALGADITTVLVGRLIFSILLSGIIAWGVNRTPDPAFYSMLYRERGSRPDDPASAKAHVSSSTDTRS